MPDREETATRIVKLERDLAALQTRVATLEARSGGSPIPLPPAGSPTFEAVLISQDGEFATLKITGSGFHPGETVGFFIDGDGPTDFTADAEGKLGQQPDDGLVSVQCPAGESTKHTIRAHGSSSGAVADSSTVSC